MIMRLRNLMISRKKEIRFILVGLLNTIWGLSAYPVIYYLLLPLELHYLIVLVINYIINMTMAFFTNKYLVFKTQGNHVQEYLRFAMLQVICFSVNLLALPAIINLFGVSAVIGQTLFAFLVILTSYVWHSRITFVSKKD